MITEIASFPDAAGRPVSARLVLPIDEPRACALLAHCFSCTPDTHAATRISLALAAQGIAVLRFDFTGLGSADEEANPDRLADPDDLVAAAAWLRTRGMPAKVLIGHGLGGAAALVAASRIPEVVAVATIAAPAEPERMKGLRRTASGAAEAHLGERPFAVGERMLAQTGEEPLLEAVRQLGKPLLLLHGPFDEVVPVDDARKIFVAARHPRSFVSLDTADHLLSRNEDVAWVAHLLSAWVGRYLPEPEIQTLPDQEEEAADRVLVRAAAGEERLAQHIRAGRHRLRADEPKKLGGDDTGPTPYDLLLAALGSCTTITLRLYADRKGWPLEDAQVELRHEKIHASDCATCDTQVGRIDRITKRIELIGPLDAEQRQRLLEIAERCPVNRTLQSEVLIETES